MNLADVKVGNAVTINSLSGHGSFRRRLLELGLLPGTTVEVIGIAPLRDPIELYVRGGSLSIRRAEAALVIVTNERCASTAQSSDAEPSLRPESLAGSTS